jgi:hypothetical protein
LDDLQQKVGQLKASKSKDAREKTESEPARECTDNIWDTLSERFSIPNANLKVPSADRSFHNLFSTTPEEPIGEFIYTAWVKNKMQKGRGYDLCS